MTRRALTMIELLLALVLLTAVVSASAAWIGMAGRLSGLSGALRREASVEAVLERIHEDLLTGDFNPREDKVAALPRSPTPPRVRVSENVLEIDSRAGVTHVYRAERGGDGGGLRLIRVDHGRDKSVDHPLLEDIVDFACVLDEERRVLEVTIQTRSPVGEPNTDVPHEGSVHVGGRRYAIR